MYKNLMIDIFFIVMKVGCPSNFFHLTTLEEFCKIDT